MNLIKKSLSIFPDSPFFAAGHFILRVAAGLMIFYIHALHKLEGGIRYWRNGAPWQLIQDVSGMHFPAPVLFAFAVTLVQLVCSLLIVAGLFTRINAAFLAGALSGAVFQNLLAGRDPQLAILYTLVFVALVFMGGGKFSIDAGLSSRNSRIGR